MRKFAIKEEPHLLSINIKRWYLFTPALIELFGLLCSLFVFVFPYDQLIELNAYLWLIYFVPVFPLYRLIRKIIALPSHFLLELDISSNSIRKNGVTIAAIGDIKNIEWNSEEIGEGRIRHLELNLFQRSKIRISTTLFLKKEHLKVGKQIARFLKIELHDNGPFEKEIIYFGQNDLSENDVGFMNNENKQ